MRHFKRIIISAIVLGSAYGLFWVKRAIETKEGRLYGDVKDRKEAYMADPVEKIEIDDVQEIYQEMFGRWKSGLMSNEDMADRPIYIINNQYMSEKFELRHENREVIIISQNDFNRLQSVTQYIIGFIRIDGAKYGRDEIKRSKKNSVTVEYSEQYYFYEDGTRHGYYTFTKEDGRWINQERY